MGVFRRFLIFGAEWELLQFISICDSGDDKSESPRKQEAFDDRVALRVNSDIWCLERSAADVRDDSGDRLYWDFFSFVFMSTMLF